MAKNYLTNKGPIGLFDMEVVVLLGFLLLDSTLNEEFFEKEDADVNDLKKKFEEAVLTRALGDGTGSFKNSGESQLLFWAARDATNPESKAGLLNILGWVARNQEQIKTLRDGFREFLEAEYKTDKEVYGQCDYSPEDILDLFEAGRIIRNRTL